MKVYVVTMYRYGDREKHSYVLGVWSTRELAYKYGLTEESWRGQKYGHVITEWNIDANECDDLGDYLDAGN
jgi:hypothetical protein